MIFTKIRFLLLLCVDVALISTGRCQWNGNNPPSMTFDRNWIIKDDTPVGSRITTVHAVDSENDEIYFDLEPLNPEITLPFRIDHESGDVYLNTSLKGRAKENLQLYVSADDGNIPAKVEVIVTIVDPSDPKTNSRNKLHQRQHPFSFPSFTNFNSGQPPPQIANNPRLYPTQNYVPLNNPSTTATKSTNITTPSITSNEKLETSRPTQSSFSSTTTATESYSIKSIEQDSKSQHALSSAMLISIITLCIVFSGVGILILIFLRKFSFNLSKKEKEDTIKQLGNIDRNSSTDSGFTMQYWRQPQIFSNRYIPWSGETLDTQATLRVGTNVKTPTNQKRQDKWEFPRHRLKIFDIIGEGAFGQVWRGEAASIECPDAVSTVAVKTLKENATEKEREDLLSELKIMKMLEPHPHVIKLLGCCTEKDPLFVIMEFVGKGKLQSYLRNSRAERHYKNMHGLSNRLTSRDLTLFVYQVAKGMDYLSSNGIIHRDLAARNILITDDHTCKVADFGFARDIADSPVYERKSEGRLPIRWMAPESLYDNIFSVKSDVWSFGVLIWEVVTLGSTPYTGLSAAEVMKKIKEGYRLEKPEHCRRELYNIMYYCWTHDPRQRPSFNECLELLEKLIVSETDYIELERFPDHSYYNVTSLSGEKV